MLNELLMGHGSIYAFVTLLWFSNVFFKLCKNTFIFERHLCLVHNVQICADPDYMQYICYHAGRLHEKFLATRLPVKKPALNAGCFCSRSCASFVFIIFA